MASLLCSKVKPPLSLVLIVSMNFIAIIPARLASTRLPNKPLADIMGKPMIVRTAEQVKKSGATAIYIATDNQQVADVVHHYGFESLMTQSDHPTGTDRLAEAIDLLQLKDEEVVVNIQGDEPLIRPDIINAVAAQLQQRPNVAIATVATHYERDADFFNPNSVKVVCGLSGQALYFSRAPIPWDRDAMQQNSNKMANKLGALKHIGIYAYRVSFLRQFPNLPRGPLELHESLEQLRALENGYSISVYISPTAPAHGVDTVADLDKVREIFKNRL